MVWRLAARAKVDSSAALRNDNSCISIAIVKMLYCGGMRSGPAMGRFFGFTAADAVMFCRE
jgi:hypothetical protein